MALAVHGSLAHMRAQRATALVEFARKRLGRGGEAKTCELPRGPLSGKQIISRSSNVLRHFPLQLEYSREFQTSLLNFNAQWVSRALLQTDEVYFSLGVRVTRYSSLNWQLTRFIPIPDSDSIAPENGRCVRTVSRLCFLRPQLHRRYSLRLTSLRFTTSTTASIADGGDTLEI